MEPRSLIETFFAKKTGITKEDIENKILGSVKESAFIDYKRIDTSSFTSGKQVDQPKIRSLIIREIVAFLNKISPGGGVVALGIEAKEKIPTKIIGVESNIIKGDSVLRDWILNDVSSIPRAFEFPSVVIEPVDVDKDKKVYFIECHPKDSNALYYSKCDELAYVREMDTTRKLQFEESARMIDAKKIAKLFVDLEEIDLRIDNDDVIYRMKIVFNNAGNKPANEVMSMLLFDYITKDCRAQNIEVDFFDTYNIKETSNINVCSKSFQQNFIQVFYPGRPVVVGFFNLRFKRENPVQLIFEIDEQYGRTKQVFNFTEVEFNKSPRSFSVY